MPSIVVNPNTEGPVYALFEVQPRRANRPETYDIATMSYIDGSAPIKFEQGENGLYTMISTADRTDGSNPEQRTGFSVREGASGVLYLSGLRTEDLRVELVDIEGTVVERVKPYLRPTQITVPGQRADTFALYDSRTRAKTRAGFMGLSVFTAATQVTLDRYAVRPIRVDIDGQTTSSTRAVA